MLQRFYFDTIQSKYIKYLLANTHIPLIPFTSNIRHVTKDMLYIHDGYIVKAVQTSTMLNINQALRNGAKLNDYFIRYDAYIFGEEYKGLTTCYKSNTNTYDSQTHFWLGEYLRAYKAYYGINLMPFYNCFNEEYLTDVTLNFDSTLHEPYCTINTDDYDTSYSIISVPIRFCQTYTIAIECAQNIQIVPVFVGKKGILTSLTKVLWNTLQNDEHDFHHHTNYYKNTLSFGKPFYYHSPCITGTNDLEQLSLVHYERFLRLLIKVPSTNTSSLVVLEGKYKNLPNNCARIINYDFENTVGMFNTLVKQPVNLKLIEVLTASNNYQITDTSNKFDSLQLTHINNFCGGYYNPQEEELFTYTTPARIVDEVRYPSITQTVCCKLDDRKVLTSDDKLVELDNIFNVNNHLYKNTDNFNTVKWNPQPTNESDDDIPSTAGSDNLKQTIVLSEIDSQLTDQVSSLRYLLPNNDNTKIHGYTDLEWVQDLFSIDDLNDDDKLIENNIELNGKTLLFKYANVINTNSKFYIRYFPKGFNSNENNYTVGGIVNLNNTVDLLESSELTFNVHFKYRDTVAANRIIITTTSVTYESENAEPFVAYSDGIWQLNSNKLVFDENTIVDELLFNWLLNNVETEQQEINLQKVGEVIQTSGTIKFDCNTTIDKPSYFQFISENGNVINGNLNSLVCYKRFENDDVVSINVPIVKLRNKHGVLAKVINNVVQNKLINQTYWLFTNAINASLTTNRQENYALVSFNSPYEHLYITLRLQSSLKSKIEYQYDNRTQDTSNAIFYIKDEEKIYNGVYGMKNVFGLTDDTVDKYNYFYRKELGEQVECYFATLTNNPDDITEVPNHASVYSIPVHMTLQYTDDSNKLDFYVPYNISEAERDLIIMTRTEQTYIDAYNLLVTEIHNGVYNYCKTQAVKELEEKVVKPVNNMLIFNTSNQFNPSDGRLVLTSNTTYQVPHNKVVSMMLANVIIETNLYTENEYLNEYMYTNLSLLKVNDKQNYAFTDRLYEYLINNVISSQERLPQNISMVQSKLSMQPTGLWSNELRKEVFFRVNDFIQQEDRNVIWDMNGFVDKDTEKILTAIYNSKLNR